MALNKDQLKSDLKTAFDNATSQSWSTAQIAQAIATAIDTYVTAADVTGIKTDPNGQQIQNGKLQ